MRWIFAALAVVVVAWTLFMISPFVGLYRLARAIEARDVAAVEARVDVPELRGSLIRQLIDGYLKEAHKGRVEGFDRQLAAQECQQANAQADATQALQQAESQLNAHDQSINDGTNQAIRQAQAQVDQAQAAYNAALAANGGRSATRVADVFSQMAGNLSSHLPGSSSGGAPEAPAPAAPAAPAAPVAPAAPGAGAVAVPGAAGTDGAAGAGAVSPEDLASMAGAQGADDLQRGQGGDLRGGEASGAVGQHGTDRRGPALGQGGAAGGLDGLEARVPQARQVLGRDVDGKQDGNGQWRLRGSGACPGTPHPRPPRRGRA